MQLTLLTSIKNYVRGTDTVMYGQEDGKYLVIRCPINPDRDNADNVHVVMNLTQEQALELLD